MYLQSQTFYFEFSTYNSATGALANADSTPTGVLVVNGVDQAASGDTLVTITNPATGVYKGSVALVSLNVLGTTFYVRVTATVNGVTAKQSTATQKMAMITGDGQTGLNSIGLGYYNNDELPGVREAMGMSAGDLDTQLDAILAASGEGGADSAEVAAAVAAALAGNAVNVSSLVVSRGVMQLVAGDKYTTSRMQPFTRTGWTGEDLNTESGKMLFIPLGIYDENANEDVATLVVAGTFSQTGTTVTMNFPMTAAETTTLNPARSGKGVTEYKVQVRANDPIGETVWLGRAEVSRNISE